MLFYYGGDCSLESIYDCMDVKPFFYYIVNDENEQALWTECMKEFYKDDSAAGSGESVIAFAKHEHGGLMLRDITGNLL